MLARLRPRSAYDVMAALSLFIVLGGTSYAVATGSIDSREIKNNDVRSRDLRDNDVRSRDVRNGALLARDFQPGELPQGARGPEGPRGEPGSTGAPGTVVRARPHGTADVADPDAAGDTVYPLTDTGWTQATDETDLVAGTVTVDVPALPQCNAPQGETPMLILELRIGEHSFFNSLVAAISAPQTIVAPVPGNRDLASAPGYLPEPQTAARRTAELRLRELACPDAEFRVTGARFAMHGCGNGLTPVEPLGNPPAVANIAYELIALCGVGRR